MKNCKFKIAMFGQKRMPSREGGVEIVVEELSTRMAKLGHDVTCYNRRGHHVSGSEFDSISNDLKEFNGVHTKSVITIDKKGLAAVSSSFFATLACCLKKYNVVHIHAEGPCFFCSLIKIFRPNTRLIATIHGLDHQRSDKWSKFARWFILQGEKQIVKHADAIIVLSKNVQDYFKQTYNRDTIFIPNGVNRPNKKEANKIYDKFNLCKDGYILFLGRLVPEKRIKYLIEAFKAVKTDKKLVIAGGSSDSQNYVNELKDLANNNSRIVFTGFVQGQILEELYSNAYMYCLPSDLEGMPLSLLEAMSYGNCCLVSDIPECSEVIEEHAVTFKKSSVEDLHHKLQELIDDPNKVESYKAKTADYICNKYNWDSVVSRTLNLYH